MTKCIFNGVGTALITPFKNGKLDHIALQHLLKKQLDANVDAIVILGTTGEPASLSEHERETIIKLTTHICKGKAKVIVGCGSNNTKTAIANYNQAEALGADGALIVTPYYNKCTQMGLIEHYSAIANSGNLPIIMYNVPSRTGVNMLPSTAETLSAFNNIYGIKEAGGNVAQVMELIKLCKNKMAIYSGEDMLNNLITQMGGNGSISVLSNITPKLCKKMHELNARGKYKKANELQFDLMPLISALFVEVNPIPVKAGLAYLGLCKNELRLPLTKLEDEHMDILKKQIDLMWEKENDCM